MYIFGAESPCGKFQVFSHGLVLIYKLSSIMYNIMYAHYRINTVESKWLKHVKNILDNCGVSFIWLSQSITICSLSEFIRLNLREQYSQ